MRKNKFILLIILFAFTGYVQAARSYSCDFEDAAQRARWTLTPAASNQIAALLTNKWYLGAPGNNGINGQYGLFVSDDNGVSAHYTTSSCFIFAYDTITLDHLSTAGNYTLSFEYRGMGNVANQFDGIYVFWIPVIDPDTGDSIKVMSIPTSSGEIPSAYSDYVIQLDPVAMQDYVGATQTWKQCVVTLKNKLCDGTPHYLAFAWTNSADATQQPGGCIDNINISDDRPCAMPTNLNVTMQGSTCVMTWEGDATRYEVSAYSYEENKWYGPNEVNEKSYTFGSLPMGQTDFVVRAICADDLMSLKTMVTQLVYYPDEMCVDYLSLSKAKCYISTSSVTNTSTFNSFGLGQPVDFGPADKESRHTIHFDRQETDPRTGGLLKTIPDGELASIRLGNWKTGAEAERIEFTFTVDSINFPVLLLKYAVVIEAPGHGPNDDPRFKLQILQGNTSLGSCTEADFNANDVYTKALGLFTDDKTWHFTPSEISRVGGASGDLVWKDWTTVGVNLSQYHGKKLTIRLTTLDCTASGHAGYAYFTIGCSDGQLKGMKCGEINPTFEAPDGFVYRWMYRSSEQYRDATGNIDDKYILGHEQKFEAGYMTDSVYAVDCMFVQDSSCYFTLYASPLAFEPQAVINNAPKIMQNCQNDIYKVEFTSESYIKEIDHITADTTMSSRKLDNLYWDFGDGSTVAYGMNVTHNFPRTGGTYNVRLTAGVLTCYDDTTYTLELPEMGPLYDTVPVYLCDDPGSYTWRSKTYNEYGMFNDTLISDVTGCDSITTLDLREPNRETREITILNDETYNFYGTLLNKQDEYTHVSPTCDSVITLKLYIYDRLKVDMPTNYILCADQQSLPLPYRFISGHTSDYSMTFADSVFANIAKTTLPDDTIILTLPLSIKPNLYNANITFYDETSGDVVIPLVIDIQYASSIVEQKWNDVLTVLNAEYNGGYDFTAYEWFKDDVSLNAFGPYLYVANGLDLGAKYQVRLTRPDGVTAFSCPVYPEDRSKKYNVSEFPSFVSAKQKVHAYVEKPASLCIFSASGILYSVYDLGEGTNDVQAPESSGMYLFVLRYEDGTTTAQRVVVK